MQKKTMCPSCHVNRVKNGKKCICCQILDKSSNSKKPYISLDYQIDLQKFIDGKPIC